MRIRSAKIRAKRYDLNYFKRFTTFQRWRLGTFIVLAILALAGLGGSYARKKPALYSAGPMSSAHSFIANRCELCHSPVVKGVRAAGFSRRAGDEGCQSCHDAPLHHADQRFTPSCSSCHVEHQGMVRLVRVHDGQCVQCHSDLQDHLKVGPPDHHPQKSDHPAFENTVLGFNLDHPEFREKTAATPTTIIFSHQAHLEKKVRYPAPYPGEAAAPDAIEVQLSCENCHRPLAEANGHWPYVQAGLPLTHVQPLTGNRLHPDNGRELMIIPNYEQQCAACHRLNFDPNIQDPAPHPQAFKTVVDFMEQKFRGYIPLHQDELRRAPERQMIERQEAAPPATNNSWVDQRLQQAERLMLRRCGYCHEFQKGGAEFPEVKPSTLKAPEMPHAIFSHEAHGALQCESCHARARSTDTSSQSLLPGIKTCQSCHNGNPAESGHADNGCYLCHQYHDWPQHKSSPGKHTIEELTGISTGGR